MTSSLLDRVRRLITSAEAGRYPQERLNRLLGIELRLDELDDLEGQLDGFLLVATSETQLEDIRSQRNAAGEEREQIEVAIRQWEADAAAVQGCGP